MTRFFFILLSALVLFCATDGSAAASTDSLFDKNLQQARSRNLSYLPQYMAQRRSDCQVYGGADRESCLQQLSEHASSVLSCPTSRKRWLEGVEHDDLQARETFLKNPPAEVPPAVLNLFARLVAAAERSVAEVPFPLKLSLVAYSANYKNAHAAVGGQVYASAGLWASEDPLTAEEVAAVLTHEIAHVVEQHGMALNCLAIEWTDSSLSVHDAQTVFQEEIRATTRFESWSQLSQSLEFSADKGAIALLKRAGLDPRLMAQALQKLRPKSSGGFSSGSHPDFDARLAAAMNEAAR